MKGAPPSRILVAGRMHKEPNTEVVWDRDLQAYALVVLLAGSGFYRGSGSEEQVKKGQVLTLFPGLPHSYGPRASAWGEAFVVFSGPVFEALEGSVLQRSRPVSVAPNAKWTEALCQIVDDWLARPEADQERGCARLHTALVELMLGPRQSLDSRMRRAAAWIEAGVPLEEAAARSGLSYEGFRKRFARAHGMAPGHYRLRHKLGLARALLLERRELSLREVAEQLGFCDQYYFSRVFKQLEGLSPGEYRRRMG